MTLITKLIGEHKAIEIVKSHNGWISVKDELPIDEGIVLLLDLDGEIMLGQYCFDKSPYSYLTEYYMDSYFDYIADLNFISHWQPLPKPPKEH